MAAERYADGELTQDELTAAYPEAWCDISAWINVEDQKRVDKVYEAANAVINVDSSGDEIGSETALHVCSVRGATEEPVQAHFLRDIFGNPFSPVVAEVDWQTPSVLALARAAYAERSLPAGTLEFDRLAVLADALEDAGCDNADILEHLRSPGLHVRGCWALDCLLGKGEPEWSFL